MCLSPSHSLGEMSGSVDLLTVVDERSHGSRDRMCGCQPARWEEFERSALQRPYASCGRFGS